MLEDRTGEPNPNIIEAEGFVLRDKDGRKRADLGFDSNGFPFMAIYNNQDQPQMRMTTRDQGAAIQLFDQDGNPKLELFHSDGLAALGLRKGDGAVRVALMVFDDGFSVLRFHGADGLAQSMIGLDENNKPLFQVDQPDEGGNESP